MKPAPFEYHAPTTVAEALDLLAEHGDEAKPLAGGQSLVPILALRLARFEHLVDLNRVDGLAGVERANGTLVVGAMTRQATIERDPTIATAAPLLSRATSLIGHFQIRNRGTIGGSIAHADPAAEYPAVALALGATMEVRSSSSVREVDADDFFEGTWTTVVAPDELLVAVRVPDWQGRCGFAVEETAKRAGDFALVGVACAVSLDDDRAGIALFGVGGTPVRAVDAERALADGADVRDVAHAAAVGLDPSADVHASGQYRKKVAEHLVARALTKAMEEATAHA